MTSYPQVHFDVARYRSLGLVANPFVTTMREGTGAGTSLEVASASNRLLAAITEAARSHAPKPIIVMKSTDIPTSYPLRAISLTEASLGSDDSLNVTYAYIQLYMMRKGRVRSTLGVVGERIAFRGFEHTLASYIETILAEPDDKLASFQVLGPEGLTEFADSFRADPVAVTLDYFGQPEMERRPELATVADIRLTGLDDDIDESEDSAEIDTTVGDAPGTGVGLPQADETELKHQAVVDYLIEYTATHLSKVVARGLRVYRERGLAAMTSEWRVTKAPRKTLAALAGLASTRFDKLVIVYDGFEGWLQISSDLRHTIMLTISEMRWLLEKSAVFVLLLEDGAAPELEEQFSAGPRLRWDFSALGALQKDPDVMDVDVAESWLAAASISDAAPSMSDPVLAALTQDASGSLEAFIGMAGAAIEDAASRGVTALDDAALAAGRNALDKEA